MTLIERTAYPRLGRNPSSSERVRLYNPSLRELELAKRTTRGGVGQQLTFLVMLKSFQRLGYFPNPEDVPEAVIFNLRSRLVLADDIPTISSRRSRQRYRDAIREYLGVKQFGNEAKKVATKAVADAALNMDDPADLVNVAIEELVKERYELPAFSTLDRLARHVKHAINARLFAGVDGRITPGNKRGLENLLETGSRGRSALNALKAAPKSATKKNLSEMQERLVWLESFGDTKRLLEGISNQKVANLAAQARALDASELKDVGPDRRRAMLVCLIDRTKVSVRDALCEMLTKIVGKIHNKGKEELERVHREKRATTESMIELLEKILTGAACQEDDTTLGRRVRDILEADGGPEILLETCASLSAHKGGNYLPLLWNFYRGQRATLFRVARSLVFESTTEDSSLTDALSFVLENDRLGRRGEFIPGELDLSFANARWKDLVLAELDGSPALARRHLEVCVFSYVAEELRTGDLSVAGSEKYADYRDQLLSWEECEPLVEQHCLELGIAPTPEGFTDQLKTLLSNTAEQVDRSYPENASVVITEAGEPVLKKASGKKPTRALKMLEAQVAERMPERNLTDVLCSIEQLTRWSKHLGPLSGSEPKLVNPRERYLLTAFCYGTNMGPAQTARHTRGLVTAHELGYTNRRHVTTGKLEIANTDVINAYARMPLPRVWGTGETAAADGMKIDLYENSLISEYHVRYGGYGGIAYHHVSDTYVALFTHFFACGVWEAVYILDGLLKNASEIQPRAVASDTQGQSQPVFGLAYTLGIQLMPRIRNWKDLIFYRPDEDITYDHIDSLFSDTVDWKLIETHWRDLMRVVISIRTGKILPSTLLRKLGNYSRKNRLYRAFREVGRAVRTEFLLRFLSNQELRTRITATTNKAESYNGFSDWLFFGGEGVLSDTDPEEQEKRMKFKELLTNSVIVQNAADLTEVLRSLAAEGYTLRREEVSQLSPYLTAHVKRFGVYIIDLEGVSAPPDGEMPELVD
ncbi:MAG: Tn3 family transposase [Rubrobacteraceae bacterium]